MSAAKRYSVPTAAARRHSQDIEAVCAKREAEGWEAPVSVRCRITLTRETYELAFRRRTGPAVSVMFTDVLRYERIPLLPIRRGRK